MKQENKPDEKCEFCGNTGGQKMIEGRDKNGKKVFAHHLCLEIAKCTLPMRTKHLEYKTKSENIDNCIKKSHAGFLT